MDVAEINLYLATYASTTRLLANIYACKRHLLYQPSSARFIDFIADVERVAKATLPHSKYEEWKNHPTEEFMTLPLATQLCLGKAWRLNGLNEYGDYRRLWFWTNNVLDGGDDRCSEASETKSAIHLFQETDSLATRLPIG
jgi:hypothetical protein